MSWGLSLGLGACRAAPEQEPARAATPATTVDLPVSLPPYEDLQAGWKERLTQPYVFLEMQGPYAEFGSLFSRLMQAADRLQIEPCGPPFGLFYDDPGRVEEQQLRSRACLPVRTRIDPEAPLGCEDLPGGVVVYGFAGGPYPKVPMAYGRLFEFMAKMRWVANGPIREIYLVDPADAARPEDLVAEVQIPAGPRGE
jgi:AraC family transcriptional regulator